MSRYIDADKLVAWCNETFQAQSTVSGKAYVNAFLTAVDSCPTADVVEVVRCKDCEHYREVQGYEYKGRKARSCFLHSKLMYENDYCSYGERREG